MSRRSQKIWWNKPCPQCGYNLRGLHGDPVTCPECGMVVPRRKPRQIDQRIEKDIRQIEFLLVTPIKHFALLLGTGLVCYYYSVWYGILMMLAQLFSLFQDAASLRQQQNVRLLWGLLKKPTTIAMITGLVITGLTFRVLTSIRPGYSFGLVVSLTTIIIVMGLYWIFWMR